MKKYLALLLALAVIVGGFAGCQGGSGGTSGSEEAGGKLIIGLDDTFAPMGFRDEAGELVGFDIDLATAMGEAIGMEIVFQPIDWDAKEMELEAKKIDCIWNGMSRTPQREESMTLSQSYLDNKIIVMTLPDVEITSKEQLADYQIGTQAKSAALEVLQADDIYATIQDNVSEYRTYDECILDMQAGRIQVMIVDEVLGQYKNNNLSPKFNVSSVDFGEDLYTIGFRKGDTALCSQVEQGLKAVIESGKGKEISEKWFGADLLLPIK
ncbi:MAG: amino acid ABC transporter substrate-binding protein [Oscillospiraceae bacterium]